MIRAIIGKKIDNKSEENINLAIEDEEVHLVAVVPRLLLHLHRVLIQNPVHLADLETSKHFNKVENVIIRRKMKKGIEKHVQIY